jgi:hypothetical protein
MLDVHPAHHAANTWRDFLVHIATIVLGLLIAVGLEQTVEAIHHHRQVNETREALVTEREIDQKVAADDAILFRREAAALENNLLVLEALRQHPGTPRAELPGILTWHSDLQTALPHTSWTTAEQTGITGLMPVVEVRHQADLYEHLEHVAKAADAVWDGINAIRAATLSQPDPSLWSPAMIDSVIDLTRAQVIKLYGFGAMLVILHQDFPEFAAGFDNSTIKTLIKMQTSESGPGLDAPLAKTIQRIDAVGKFADYFPQADGTQR